MNYAEASSCSYKPFSELLTDAVIKYRPVLAEILKESGASKLAEYSSTLYTRDDGATPEFIASVSRRAGAILGERVATNVESQLKWVSSVHTGDHHALLCHPTPFQANVLAALGAKRQDLPCMLTLSFGDVPLNNKFFPRGAIWNEKMIPLFSNKWRHAAVFGMRSATKEALMKLPQEIKAVMRPELFEYELFSEQITALNGALWANAFADTDVPDLVYLQAEDIACDLLAIAISDRSPLYRAIFERDVRALVLDLFENIPGCWLGARGSHFFWARNGLGEMVQLRIQGEFLVPVDSTSGILPIPLDPWAILDHLSRRELIPTMFTTFGAFLLNRVRCLGGFQQNDYLTQMKRAWANLLTLLGAQTDLDRLSGTATRGYSFGPIFYLDEHQKPGTIATVLQDRCLEVAKMFEGFERLKLYESNAIGLTQVYNIIVPELERMEVLQRISCADVANEFLF